MSDDPKDVPLEGLLGLLAEQQTSKLWVSIPAAVTQYDANRQMAEVQIQIKRQHVAEDETSTVQAIPPIPSVPVWMFGGSSGRVTVPVKKGDVGLLVFCSGSLDRWKQRGGVVDPADYRTSDLNDCFFLPGGHPPKFPPTTAPTDAVVIHGANKLGGPSGTEPTIKATIWEGGMDAVIASIVSALGNPGPGAAVATAWTTFKTTILYKTTLTEVK